MNLPNIVSGLFWLAMSFFVCLISIQYGIGTLKSPGPGFLPFWSGAILGGLSITLVLKAVVKTKVKEMADLWKGTKWYKVVLVLASLYIYTVFLPILGYIITTFLEMTFLLSLIERSRMLLVLVSALIIVLTTHFIFYVWLGVQLPKGVFGF
jgi:putative tricarboxylic transport membrane protein